jgi:hypothetical protein
MGILHKRRVERHVVVPAGLCEARNNWRDHPMLNKIHAVMDETLA